MKEVVAVLLQFREIRITFEVPDDWQDTIENLDELERQAQRVHTYGTGYVKGAVNETTSPFTPLTLSHIKESQP